jgi:hypothetical protein
MLLAKLPCYPGQGLPEKLFRPEGVAHVRVVGRRRCAISPSSASSSSRSTGSTEFKSCSAKAGLMCRWHT